MEEIAIFMNDLHNKVLVPGDLCFIYFSFKCYKEKENKSIFIYSYCEGKMMAKIVTINVPIMIIDLHQTYDGTFLKILINGHQICYVSRENIFVKAYE